MNNNYDDLIKEYLHDYFDRRNVGTVIGLVDERGGNEMIRGATGTKVDWNCVRPIETILKPLNSSG